MCTSFINSLYIGWDTLPNHHNQSSLSTFSWGQTSRGVWVFGIPTLSLCRAQFILGAVTQCLEESHSAPWYSNMFPGPVRRQILTRELIMKAEEQSHSRPTEARSWNLDSPVTRVHAQARARWSRKWRRHGCSSEMQAPAVTLVFSRFLK